MEKLSERDLYEPVKACLESLGYDVKGEVRDCDMTAIRDDELLVVELKRNFTLELIYQALNRQKIADSVYVAVPLPEKGYRAPHIQDMQTLCRRLSLGLIFVGFSSRGIPQIDIAVHPTQAAAPRRDKTRRLAVIREHETRTGSLNTGGVNRTKILTAYKEQSLYIARILQENGPLRADEVRRLGGPDNTAAILNQNVLGWFDRAEKLKNGRYLYKISEEGASALLEFSWLFNSFH